MNKFESGNYKGNILIVDDTLSSLQVLVDMLAERGYHVRGAPDGKTALMIVETSPPELILLDVLMPGMDGYEVCRRLRDTAPDVPVIFISALDQTLDKVRAFEVGGVDYVTKPFQAKEVLARVQTHLSLTSLKRRLEAQNAQLQRANEDLAREIQERERAERALQRAHDELERRVEERTAALRRSEATTKAILDAVPDMMFLIDRDGVFLDFIPAAADEPLVPPEIFLGENIRDIMPPKVAKDHVRCVEKALQSGEMQVVEYQLEVSGEIKHYEARIVVSGEDRVLALARDVTERVRAEAELRARNAELDRFTYTVSHDLKNPLISITGFLGFLEQDIAAGDAERVKTDIARISNAALKMERLLDELLQLSRVGRVVKPPEETPLSELLRDALDMVAGRLAERGAQVQFAGEMLRADELVIYGDRTRLLQVLQNLLDNAIKFMGDQPEPRVELGARSDKARGMVYYVRDNGIGIDPRYHEKVFDLFEKLDPGGEGSGVGLALVKRIVEVHGGSVWVESGGAGQGSTFCFTIPGNSDPARGGQA